MPYTDPKLRRILFLRFQLIPLLAFAVLAGAGIFAFQRSENASIHRSLEIFCRQANISKAVDNISHMADYQVYNGVLEFIPKSNTTLRNTIKAAIAEKTWTQLNNCTSSSSRGEIVIHTIQDIKPPASQLDINNAIKPNPVGSLQPKPPGVTLTTNGHTKTEAAP